MHSIAPVIATRRTISLAASIVLAVVAYSAFNASLITIMMPFVKRVVEHER